ncbi:MAG: type II toxin-antitoxin system VapC family toxin [Candidatus Aenigmatarchaeota archaeon]
METDFLLALLKEEDWLKQRAEEVYREREDEIWTSRYTLIEILIVSEREGWDPVEMISGASELLEVRGDIEEVKAASSHMRENGLTPFDALHLAASGEDGIISSESDYDEFSEKIDLDGGQE